MISTHLKIPPGHRLLPLGKKLEKKIVQINGRMQTIDFKVV